MGFKISIDDFGTGFCSLSYLIYAQIDNIKNKGTSATSEIKQLIKDADTKQTESLKSIKSTISSMLQTDKLDTAVKNLEGDIKSLASVTAATTGQNPNAPVFDPTKGVQQSANVNATRQLGGYTYGKHKKGSRRRRGKKSRKKGSSNKNKR